MGGPFQSRIHSSQSTHFTRIRKTLSLSHIILLLLSFSLLHPSSSHSLPRPKRISRPTNLPGSSPQTTLVQSGYIHASIAQHPSSLDTATSLGLTNHEQAASDVTASSGAAKKHGVRPQLRRRRRRTRGRKAGNGGRKGSVRPRPADKPQYSPYSAIKYFGGPIMVQPITVHLIYYGSWNNTSWGDSGQSLLRTFISSISASQPSGPGSVAAWWGTTCLYSQKDGQLVTPQVTVGAEVYDYYSSGSNLLDDSGSIWKIIRTKVATNKLPANPNAVYFVLTSADVTVGPPNIGFCGAQYGGYCGWHDTRNFTPKGSKKSVALKYAFVGNAATQCPGRCTPNGYISPNPIPGIDGIIDILGHELSEAATNPDTLRGWLTSQSDSGMEDADICRSIYISTKKGNIVNGAQCDFNMAGINGTQFLVQSIYNPVQAVCTLQA